ncbi:3'-5' ssDNA/RNA exonuclease TatD [Emticicia aquatica]|jgi:TatD DNase family protein|uniref:3'-5' ssDNA/RNA exonuclease TatD n=1 Tax=Emticicia aquatica TaxID=1681835 RepID=A0ABN8ETW5_9BACT|nr:TatD family hydrolase [Emticicia aquatica]CAH0995406.1 3'-5' ssDNA/RNA exonuclease TatD [Emticicia aquatica]
MLLNIHTHQAEKQADEQIIYNYIIPEVEEELASFTENINANDWLSIGIHPWFISENNQKTQLEKLRQLAYNQTVKFIGECGLDRLKGSPLPLQEEIFIKQIRIAEEVKKPIIIHCVKCFNELLSIKKIVRPKVPMIVHGFNNNQQIAQTLLERGFYLSLGAAILNLDSNAAQILKKMPLEKLFLETDDSAISILEIYERASFLLNIPQNILVDTIFSNYLEISSQSIKITQ